MGLNYYRVSEDRTMMAELNVFSGRAISVPACFIGGENDWATYQNPGAFESMGQACTQLLGTHIVPRAGDSIPEEQSARVNEILLEFFAHVRGLS